MNTANDNCLTSKQWISSCYAMTDSGTAIVVHEKEVTIDKTTHDIVDVKNNLRLIKDPKRRVYVTKPQFRNHKYKKETEFLDRTDCYTIEDRYAVDHLKKILDINPYKRMSLMEICDSPYIYGADVSMESLVRQRYIHNAQHQIVPITTGAFDIEKSVLGDDQINCITFIAEENIYTAVHNSFMWKYDANKKKHKATKNDIIELAHNLLGRYLNQPFKWPLSKKSNTYKTFKLHVEVFDTEEEVLRWTFSKIHEEKMDFIGIWNIGYDIPTIIDRLKKLDIDPKDIFCDPSIPKEYRKAYFKEDKKKVQHIADKWHWFDCTSYSQFVDSMLLYNRVRKVNSKEPSYSLDAISNKEVGEGKLKFDNIGGHYEMQTTRFVEYVVYNIMDAILIQLMEWKNTDMTTMYHQTGNSPLSELSKQSVMLKNKYAEFCLHELPKHPEYIGKPKVYATVGKNMKGPFDDIIGKVGGAVLKADNTCDIGTKCIIERQNLETMVLQYGADQDYSAIYPTTDSTYGISKETKLYTCVGIEGMDRSVIEPLFGGLANPKENAVWIGHDYFGLPNYTEMREIFGTWYQEQKLKQLSQ